MIAFGLFVINISVMLLQTIPMLTDAGYNRATAAAMIAITSVPALASKPVWGWLIDELKPAPLASASSALTATSLFVIVWSNGAQHLPGLYAGFFLLGVGWGGMIPLQEVIRGTYFGRLHIGVVRSAALPFSLLFSSGAPLATSYYFDTVGDYDGTILAVAAANLVSSFMLLAIPRTIVGTTPEA